MTLRHGALLAALAAIWGGSYLLIKYALEDLSAPVIVCARCALAAGVLFAALRLTAGRAAVRAPLGELRTRPRWAFGLAAAAVGLPFMLITLGEHTVPSGLTAVLITPSPLFVAMLAPFVDVSQRTDRIQLVGMLMGMVGVGLVVGVESVQSLGELLGALAIVAASASYAVGTFVLKRGFRHLRPMQASCVSVTGAAILTLPPAVATAPTDLPGGRAIAAVVVLGAVGTALAFVIFYALISEIGPARASLVSYLAPGVALLYGAALLDESITLAAVAGLALVLGGVALASRARRVEVAAPAAAAGR